MLESNGGSGSAVAAAAVSAAEQAHANSAFRDSFRRLRGSWWLLIVWCLKKSERERSDLNGYCGVVRKAFGLVVPTFSYYVKSSYYITARRMCLIVSLLAATGYIVYLLYWLGLRDVDVERMRCHLRLRELGYSVCGWRHGSHVCMWSSPPAPGRGERVLDPHGLGVSGIIDLKAPVIDWSATFAASPGIETVIETYPFCPSMPSVDSSGATTRSRPSQITQLYTEVMIRHSETPRESGPISARHYSKCLQALTRYNNPEMHCLPESERPAPDSPIPLPPLDTAVVSRRV